MIILALMMGCGTQELVLEDAQNYAFESTVSGEATVIKAYSDATVEWSGLNPDLLGKSMEPSTDADLLTLVRFNNLSVQDVLDDINADALKQADVSGSAELAPADGSTSGLLSEFGFLGTLIDPTVEVEPDATYMVNIATDDVTSYRQLAFFTADEAETNTTLSIDSDSATLDYTVDLFSMAPLTLDNSRGDVSVDWTALETNGAGRDFKVSDIDTMLLARYDESLEEIEGSFLLLEELPEQSWEADISGVGSWNLRDLTDASGANFEGFNADGTWLLALLCSDCINPAPPFLGVINY